MGTTIIPIDLSTAVVGTTGDINIPTVTSGEGYHLLLFNESGCGLKLRFLQSDDTDSIPAGGWRKYPLIPGETTVTWTVIYVLPNAPVSMLIGTIYKPGEEVPEIGTLGNSPIAIGGTVNTVGGTASSIQNDGNVAGTRIMEATVAGDGPSAVILTNYAQFTLGDANHPGNMTMQGHLDMVGAGPTNGNVNINNALRFYNNLSVARLFALILAATNNPTLLTSSDHGQLDIYKSNQSTRLARFDEAAGLDVAGTIAAENQSAPSMNGATGTATLYQAIVGAHLKIAIMEFVNYKGLAGSAQALTLPTAFTDHAWVFGADLPSVGVAFLASGVAQTITIITGLGIGGGTSGPATVLKVKSFGSVRTGFDSIQVPAADANTTNDTLLIVGF
jgi:hypothetical protein